MSDFKTDPIEFCGSSFEEFVEYLLINLSHFILQYTKIACGFDIRKAPSNWGWHHDINEGIM
jgi:hypothetical protein